MEPLKYGKLACEHYIHRSQIKNDLHGSGAFVLMCAEMERYLNV